MTKPIVIVGAGMAGLLAARMLSPRRLVRVVERQPHMPNNHSAVLRFRSSAVGDVLGIPFRRVRVVKAVARWRNPVADSLSYARKVSGTYRSDRSLPLETEQVERWIAPPDLIARMADGLNISYGRPWDFSDRSQGKVISTIPMPALAAALHCDPFRETAFEHRSGVNVRFRIENCHAHVSLYVPDPDLPFSRVSVTDDQVIAECPGISDVRSIDPTSVVNEALELLGMVEETPVVDGKIDVLRQDYQKIMPIDEGARRQFIYWASTEQNIAFSLGRFATWRPTLLADDLVKDVRLIEGWIDSPSPGYDQQRHERSRA